jgi:hypothetical protein
MKRLWLFLRYWLLYYRPVPLLARCHCECGFIYNTDLYNECPFCGCGKDTVWALFINNGLHSLYSSKKLAERMARFAIQEHGRAAVYYISHIVQHE